MHFPHPDIKIGETYNLRIHVIGKNEDFIIARPITQNGGYATSSFLEILHKYAPSFTPLPSEHGTSLSRRSSVGAETEVPTPKYDPCRLFKKGDKVRVVEWNGRAPIYLRKYIGTMQVVECDEDNNGVAGIVGDIEAVSATFLELVTPVEELERYVVEPGDIAWFVVDKKHKSGELNVVMYMNTHPNPKAAAEAECARLNAEYRKEQNNG